MFGWYALLKIWVWGVKDMNRRVKYRLNMRDKIVH